MSTLIQLGSCGASWPQNTTPIQRLAAISPIFDRVVLVDTASDPSPFIQYNEYVQLRGFTLMSLRQILRDNRDDKVVVWLGPSHRLAILILILRLFMRFYFVVDLYDHERLSSGIARAHGAFLRSLKYRIFESFTALAARRADLLVSAIAENRYAKNTNRIKAVNGVAINLVGAFDGSGHSNENLGADDAIIVCYVGLITRERAGLLEELATADYGTQLELLLIGDNDPAFLDLLHQRSAPKKNVRIVAPGFLPWREAMRLVAKSDVCLYVFPNRPELDCVYPIKMGEYMELGKPVIATDTTAIREIFSDCPGVVRCDIEKPDEWTSALQVLVHAPEKRRALGSKNQAFVRDRLDWSVTQSQLLSRLSALLASNTKGR